MKKLIQTLLVGGGVLKSSIYLGMNPVSTVPALKAWWSRISLWKGPVVGTPVITHSSSARCMRAMACREGVDFLGGGDAYRVLALRSVR